MWASVVTSEEIDRFDLGSLRLLLSGGSPLLTHTKDAILRRFPKAGLNEFYGGTEVGLVTNLSPEDQRRKVRSVGRPVTGMFVELRDEQGNVVPQGEVGEIHIGGATIIREYFNNPEATADARRGAFFTLGDMGRFDEEGYLYIVDRKKDMIISGGENIFPNDIEEILHRHPAVEMAAVVRRSRSDVGRNRRRGRQIEAWQFGRAGRTHRALQDIPVQLQGSEEDRLSRPDADVFLRQNTSARRQKILLGTPGSEGLMSRRDCAR